MRICLYTETALPKMGGQEMVVDALARQYLALGHEPVVLAPRPRWLSWPDDSGYPYPVARHPRFLSTRHFVSWYQWFLRRLHQREGFDVLHCHGLYPPGYLAALARQTLAIPVLITSHGGDVYAKNVRLAKRVVEQRLIQGLEAADVLIAISRFTREGFRRLCPNARRIVDLPNGVHLEPFASQAERPVSLDPAIRPGEYVVFLGRLNYRKGVDVLLRAVAQTPPTAQAQLVVIGDGEERRALEMLAVQLGVRQRVHFVGQQVGPAKVYLLQNAIAGVVPSRMWEAFPLVVLECHAAGLPVIGTRIPGLEDLVQPRETGWLVDAEAVAPLAAALQEVNADRALARRMGEHGLQLARNYSWRNIAQRHLQLYSELCETRKQHRQAA